ncbi:hypothetical protein [Saccharothrix obliqua]|uniref:hypothetical protein n=1 Tax=Saccharothrix obliqua TaxID=2861747 RepID=UPI001C5DC035|nr:hypothetical protein [Saccharothrix obliqua]MBW4721870.1 hypothetical protein [Saccharothrix obliqua]
MSALTGLLVRLAPGEAVPADVPFVVAAAANEHLNGVRPLLAEFRDHPTLVAARAGRLPTALAAFTANAALAWGEPAVHAREEGGRVVLAGRFRVAFPGAAAVVVTGFADGTRLCLVDLTARGVVVGDAGWVDVTDVVVDPALVSGPVRVADPGGPLLRAIDTCAWAYAGIAWRHATAVVADLRRVLAATATSGPVFSTSQLLAHELTRLDIELSLLGDALGEHGSRVVEVGGEAVVAVLAAATDLVHRTGAVAADLVADLGLPAGPVTPDGYFGGRRMVEAELARRMGVSGGAG